MKNKSNHKWLIQKEITNKIIKLSGYDILKKSRKREVVEYRALACFIFRIKFEMQWTDIVRFFKSVGLERNHATIIWSVTNYNMYARANKKLKEIEEMITYKELMNIKNLDRETYLENKCNYLEEQLEKLTNGNNLHSLINNIPKELEGEAIARIELLIKGFQWKYRDSTTAYTGE